MVKKISRKIKEFYCKYYIIMIMLIVFDWSIQHVQCAQNGTFIVRLACAVHKRAITARIIYAPEKTIYRLKKTIYGLKRLFTG